MSATVFAIVLLAAVLHACWNAMVKGGADKAAAMTAVILGQAICGLLLLPFAPLPSAEALPWLAGGVALHLGYNVFLIQAYRIGDLELPSPDLASRIPWAVSTFTLLPPKVAYPPLVDPLCLAIALP